MTQTNIATAADYADAMITARRTKGWLFSILLAILVIQLAVFFVSAYTDLILVSPTTETTAAEEAEAAAAEAGEADAPAAVTQTALGDFLQYFNAFMAYIALVAGAVLAAVLLVLVFIMLVVRAIGLSRMTSAWVWSVVLLVILFPLQALLISPVTVPAIEQEPPRVDRYPFKFPGVLYTWTELADHARFMHREAPIGEQVLKWTRFVAYPVVAMIILLLIQVKSNRGLRMALGEDDEAHAPPPGEV